MYVSWFRSVVFALGIAGLWSSQASAQRADDNAVRAADDAFGTTVGNETIGLYDARNARGFNPQQSGNVRIEGMYYDRPSTGPGDVLVDRLFAGSTVRVGVNALTFPFPAPSAVVDIRLRKPMDRQVTSVVATYGPYNGTSLELDTQVPVIAGKLSIGGGVEHTREISDMKTDTDNTSFGGLMRFTPTDSVELTTFWGQARKSNSESMPFMFVGGDWLPPRQVRGVQFPQAWNQWTQYDTVYGGVGSAKLGGAWTLRTGLFRATYDRHQEHATFFNNTQPDGTTDVLFQKILPVVIESTSGEVQAQGVYNAGDFRHIIYLMGRGRETSRASGGSAQVPYGVANINSMPQVQEPVWVHTPQGFDSAKQFTGGIQYVGQWRNVGDVNLGIQKTKYDRELTHPVNGNSFRRQTPWLYNGSVSIKATPDLTLFTSYTKGLEDGGSTPINARNRGEAVPATITKQAEVGFLYIIRPGLRMNGAVFQITKPFFDRDLTTLYTVVGDMRQRGVELSFTGSPLPGLNIVAGGVILQPRVFGPLVDQGLVGTVPVGKDESVARLDVQYGPASWRGFSLEGQIEFNDRGYGNTLNRADIPARAVLNLGARYRFQAFGTSGNIRARVQNVTNVYSWDLQGGNNFFFQYLPQRRFTISLAADF
ncbi:MAG: hypothetical protein AB7E79_06815 [Rhodospirillaceae bacterium]